jgi:hypothetical protein
MTSLTEIILPLIINKNSIINIFCSKWISHRISHVGLCLRCDIALRNPFTFDVTLLWEIHSPSMWHCSEKSILNKSTIVYIYYSCIILHVDCIQRLLCNIASIHEQVKINVDLIIFIVLLSIKSVILLISMNIVLLRILFAHQGHAI